MAEGSRKVVYAALIGNVLVAATKAVAAAISGSSSMLSEAIHTFVDTGNEGLLLYGLNRSRKRPDRAHPFGYGRELYFWSFVVALMFFAAGACASFYEGMVRIAHPEPIARPIVNYAVLALSMLFEVGSWIVAYREFRTIQGNRSWFAAMRRSKDPPKFMVLLEDSAAIIGLLAAFAGTWASVRFGDSRFDGYASLAIAALLAAMSVFLAIESKGLLIGEAAEPALTEDLKAIVEAMDGVAALNGSVTLHLAPNQVAAALSLRFERDLDIDEVERIVARIEKEARERRPELIVLFMTPQKADSFRGARARRVDSSTRDPDATGAA